MFAFTNVFVAGPELPWVESVERVTSTELVPSLKCQTAVAVAVNVPGLLLLIVTVQLAVLVPSVGVLQVSDSESGVGEMCGVIDVSVAVVPAGSAVVVIVNVWACPTGFTPFGLIEMFASTIRLVSFESPHWPLAPSVFGESPLYDAVQ
jgi:hypothetical protein